MKKHIVIILTTTFLFTFSSIFYACTQDDPVEEIERTVELDNFEEDIQAVFKVINQDIIHVPSARKIKFNSLFLKAVTEVFPSSTTQASFQSTFTTAEKRSKRQKDIAPTDLERLIASFEDENQAIQVLNSRIESSGFTLEEKQEFIALRESILFITANRELLSEHMAYLQGKKKSTLAKCGWWESWGNCASAVIGGAISGASSGCAGGAAVGAGVTLATGPGVVAGAITGCKIGAAVGAIGGALEGAAGNCDGCQN